MLFGDVIAIALSIAGFLVSLQGLWLVCLALWPRRVARAIERCDRNAVRSFLVGLVLTAAFAVVVAVVAGRGGTFGQLAGFALAFLYLIYAGVGVAAFATHIGRRLASPADAERHWKATVRGGVVLELAYLVPGVGQLAILPISFLIGAGATTLSFFGGGRKPAADYVRATGRPDAAAPPPPVTPVTPVPPPLNAVAPSASSSSPELEPAGVSR